MNDKFCLNHLAAAVLATLAVITSQPASADDRRGEPDKDKPPGVVKSLNGLSGQVVLTAGTGVTITPAGNGLKISAPSVVSPDAWSTTGNAGTVAGVNFLGTTDDQPLELKVNGQRALRLEPNAGGAPNVIGGASLNFVAPGVKGAAIGGGGGDSYGYILSNSVSGNFATIGGGDGNTIGAGASDSTISGGAGNTIQIDSNGSTVAGGYNNSILTNTTQSTVGGGSDNVIQTGSAGGTIAGGFQNSILASSIAATIGGGGGNAIQTNAAASTIGGGSYNLIQAHASSATIAGGAISVIGAGSHGSAIGGGGANSIQDNCWFATIAGGTYNLIKSYALGAIIGGGEKNIVGAFAVDATVGGGNNNAALGRFSMIPGGEGNTANGLAFAAGRRAKALHVGSFVWADSTDSDVASTANNQFSVRASGGTVFYSDANATVGVQLAAGGNSWAPASDRNLKENFLSANARDILSRVVALPIQTYNLKTQDPSIRHIGPMAQDFRAAFAVGEDDKHITTLDADGVALAAIQGLNQKVDAGGQRSEVRIQKLEAENTELKARLEKLEQLMEQTEGTRK